MTNEINFNKYINKFKNKFLITTGEDYIRIINGKFGKIAPYDPKNELLGVWCINLSKRKKSSLLNQLKPYLIEVHQDCDCEFGAYFHEKDLNVVCKAIKAKRKRQLSEQQRKKLSELAKQNFNINNKKTFQSKL